MGSNWVPVRKGQLGVARFGDTNKPVRVAKTDKGKAIQVELLSEGKICADAPLTDRTDDADIIENWSELHCLPQGFFKDVKGLAAKWAEMGNGLMIDQYKYVATTHFNHRAEKVMREAK